MKVNGLKKVFLLLLLCLLCAGAKAWAEEKPYIVKLNHAVQLFADGPVRKSQQFVAVSEEELEEMYQHLNADYEGEETVVEYNMAVDDGE